MGGIVYFSTKSGNTHAFVQKLGFPAQRIPIKDSDPFLRVEEPYILILPTYGEGTMESSVLPQVTRFLDDDHNRSLIRGVIAGGNTNFGAAFGLAGKAVAKRCNVPLLYRFEVMGTPLDVQRVQIGVTEFWKHTL